MGHFSWEKAAFFKFLDFYFTFEKAFGMWVDLE